MGVEAVEEAVVKVEGVEEVVRIAEVRVKQEAKVQGQVRGQARVTPDTRQPGMQTYLHLNRASVTGPMGNLLIFVLNPPRVPGKIISYLNLIIRPEGLTSSAMKK